MRLWIITGPSHSGKTTTFLALNKILVERGLRIGGIAQITNYTDNSVSGYDLLNLQTQQKVPFAVRKSAPEKGKVGFAFSDLGWNFAENAIIDGSKLDVLMVDEIGRLEAEGAGHIKSLLKARKSGIWVLCVRDVALNLVLELFGPAEKIFKLPNTKETISQILDDNTKHSL